MSDNIESNTPEPETFPSYVVDAVEPQPATLPKRDVEHIVPMVPESE